MNAKNDNRLFEIQPFDIEFYEQKLKEFLPDEIFDIHNHVWVNRLLKKDSKLDLSRVAKWPPRVASDNSIEDLLESNQLFFPDKTVTPLIFSTIWYENDLEKLNQYCSECASQHNVPALAVTRPDMPANELEALVKQNGFLGVKPYLTFSPQQISSEQVTIFDFMPENQLEVINRNGWAVMMHIPRSGRIRDPKNLEQLCRIEEEYPNIKLIVAHIGRAYCVEDIGNGFDLLKNTKNLVFDFCANTNAKVFKRVINEFGPQRILYGSDLPITRMRMERIYENGKYVNLVHKGAYGDVSDDSTMREIDHETNLTFFLYEQIDAFRRAAEATGLTDQDIKDVFYNNAKKLLGSSKTPAS